MRKLLPYIIIILFSIGGFWLRYFVFTKWSLSDNLYAMIFQVVILIYIWQVVQWLNQFLHTRVPFSEGVARRMAIQIAASFLLTIPIFFLAQFLLNTFLHHLEYMSGEFRALVLILFVMMIMLANFTFYAYYFFDEWKRSIEDKARLQVMAAEAEKERSRTQYQHLKNQVNPHFLFNTLTSLDGLILSQPELASEFVRHLSKVYRYVLEHTENEVVTLQTELNFIRHYISVLKMKHGDALHIELCVSTEAMDKGIAMVTLQMLIDNAIKHNIVHPKSPLTIHIYDERETLLVRNNKQLRRQIETSTRQGLQHLRQLYGFLSQQPVVVLDERDFFQVKLPLL